MIDDTSCNQYVDAQAFSDHFKMVEVTAPLYLSGCLSPLRQDVFPCIATRGLRIKIELNTIDSVAQMIKAPVYKLDNGANVPTGDYGGYEEGTGYTVQATVADNTNVIVLKKANDLLPADTPRVLSPDNATPTHLFSAGQYINVHNTANADVEVQIQSVALTGDNRIQLALTANLTTGLAVDSSVWISTDQTRMDLDFELTGVRWNVGTVEPPPSYMDAIVSKVKAGKFNFDIFSYTDYPRNISTSSLNNTLPLNCRNQEQRRSYLSHKPVQHTVFRPIPLSQQCTNHAHTTTCFTTTSLYLTELSSLAVLSMVTTMLLH